MKYTNDVCFAKICLININKIIDSEHYIQNSLLGEWLNEWHCISLGVTRYCFMYCLICRQIVSAYRWRNKKNQANLLCGTLTIITLTTDTLRSTTKCIYVWVETYFIYSTAIFVMISTLIRILQNCLMFTHLLITHTAISIEFLNTYVKTAPAHMERRSRKFCLSINSLIFAYMSMILR